MKESPEFLRLENAHIAVQINAKNGAMYSIRDKDQDIEYVFSGVGFDIITGNGSFRPGNAAEAKVDKNGAELFFTLDGLEVTLFYSLGLEDRFIEKWIEIKSKDGAPYFLESVVLEDMTSEAFTEIHFHDDQTIWHCPINLFLRGEKGGCFAGLEYPYWDLTHHDNEGFRLGYQPNYKAGAGEINMTEKYFLGIYRNEGIQRDSQGPYPGRGRSPLIGWDGIGLGQHFKDGIIPPEVKDVPPEVLDWGEVWAMQDFMRHFQPDDLQLPEDGYWIWQNGWWARLFDPKLEILDTLKAAGIHDVMTAHTWYGRGNHPNLEAYLYKMRIDPLGFPRDAAVAGLAGGNPAAGWHTPQEVELDVFKPGEFTTDFQAPPAMQKFIDYGKEIGVHVNSFAVPGLRFEEKPEWQAIDENGDPSMYLFGRVVSCPANSDYMDHVLALHESVFSKFQPRWWGWDGRWMSYWEVAAFRSGPKGCGPDPCYAKNHGHLPGDNRYKEWKNIQLFLKTIRERHPRLCLETYYGLKRGEPWALRNINATENYYESNGPDMSRLQAWHNQNDRFRPVYKNYSSIFGTETSDFQFNVIAALSSSAYCQIGPGFDGLALEENREFLKKWRAWATRNHKYLKVKRDLFGCPGDSSVDGSAHIIGDRGFLFLFPGGFDKKEKHEMILRASIPLHRWLGLDESPDTLYQITELYPREGIVLGTLSYGEEFCYDMPNESAVVLELKPAAGKGRKPQSIAADQEKQVRIIPAFPSEADKLPPEGATAIVNGTDWLDIEGRPIQAHEGDIARFNGVFYWYGSSYENNPKGKFDIADGPVWNGVQVYSSTDLKNWQYQGVALPRPDNGWGKLGATGRSHVMYNDKTKKYVMWYRWYLHMPASFLMVATADRPEGPFSPLGPREMGTANGFASDMNVFKDDDGKAYVIYCDHETEATRFAEGANGRYAIRIDSLSDDYLSSNKDGIYVFQKGCEAPCIIKYKGKYIAVASGARGWAGSETVCAIADSPLGTYSKPRRISERNTWNSQVTDLVYLEESDTVMALCDQWWIPDESDINASRYLFLPLQVDSDIGAVTMKYRETWKPFDQLDNERDKE